MASSNQIEMRILQAIFGIIGICIMAINFLCVCVILCILILAGQARRTAGAS